MLSKIGLISRIVITVSIVVLAGWATVAAIWGGPGDTISEHVRDYATQYPLILVAAGVLIGHWWWNMPPPVRRE